MSNVEQNFYVIGGTLQSNAASYVPRRADEELLSGLSEGNFCYVLTSRQIGKSSLMVSTAARLRAAGTTVAVIDLTAVGQNLTAEQWYDGLLSRVGRQLDLEDELEDFWEERERFGPLQRWTMALREVVLEKFKGRVVIFVDEIDAVRSLPFSTDEFFAAIREFYNRRTEDPELNRLAFCLLGVATPSDLIRDTRTTPFNIGRRVELTDFTEEEAAPLAAGFGREQGRALVKRVLYWTGGHPYLTQRLCRAVASDETVTDARGVDRLCEDLFLSPRARERDDNLLFVRERILRNEADLAGLLDLYLRVREGKRVTDDEANPLVSVLRLAGIVRSVDGRLRVRNRIYHHVFDKAWVTAGMPDAELRRQRAAYRRGMVRAAGIAAVILAVMVFLAAAAIGQRNRALDEKRRADESFSQLRIKQGELETALAEAKAQREIAETERAQAEEQRQEAERQRQIAAEGKQEAEAERARAVAAQRVAETQRQLAGARAREAEVQRLAAESNFHKAEQQRARAEDLSKLSINTIFNITRFLEGTNEKERAALYYEQLAQIYRQAERKREESDTLINVGGIFVQLREEQKAEDYFRRSLAVFRSNGASSEDIERGRTLIKIGGVYGTSGDQQKATAYYGQALSTLQSALSTRGGTSERVRADALYHLSLAYDGLGDKQKALDYSRQALPLFRSIRDEVMVDILDIRIEELSQTLRERK